MSWILGFVGTSLSRKRRERLDAFVADPLVEIAGETYFLAAGGLRDTCLAGGLPENRGHWCVIGTGVLIEEDHARILSSSDWLRRLVPSSPLLEALGGGFIALRVTADRVEGFSDAFGLRTLYWLRTSDGSYFSSRLDWLAALAGGLAIDYPTFGSHWMTYNQLSLQSMVSRIGRLGPGGRLTLTDADVEERSHPYSLPEDQNPADIRNLLRMQLRPDDPRTVSLGLSGGMDSRTLLALSGRHDRFSVHVFGPKTKADVHVALTLAEEEDLRFSHFDFPPPGRDALLETVRGHAMQTHAVSPASSAISLRYYPELRSQQKLVVDGAFGELLRRQFMNRLVRRGADAVKARDVSRALEHIQFERAPVFSDEARREMEFGTRRDLALRLDALPDISKYGVENVVDLWNVHTRLPNFFGYEQARLDGLVQSYMPFAHPLAVDAALRIPASSRKGGRVARRIIARQAPRLRRYPLVKGGVLYPYGMPAVVGMVWVRIQKRFGSTSDSTERTYVLQTLKEYILDRIHSSHVRNYPAYDWSMLDTIAGSYYANGSYGPELDWWLAFDFWREAIESPSKFA